MHIGLLTCIWQREVLFDLCASAVRGLRLPPQWSLTPVAVGSEGEKSRLQCEGNSFLYLEAPNRPVSEKFNVGLCFMRQFQPDYVIILGSDDFISPNFLEVYADYLELGHDLIGLTDLYFYDAQSQRMIYWPGYEGEQEGQTIGAGRALSRNLLDKVSWRAWHRELNRGLDLSMGKKLARVKHSVNRLSLKSTSMFALDIKTDLNITSFKYTAGLAGALDVDAPTILAKQMSEEQQALLAQVSLEVRERQQTADSYFSGKKEARQDAFGI